MMTDEEGDQPVISQPLFPLTQFRNAPFSNKSFTVPDSPLAPPFLMTNIIPPPLNSYDKPNHKSEIPFESSEFGWD